MSRENLSTPLFSGFNTSLREEILAHSELKEIPADTEILRESQYVKVLPIVVDGLVKVVSRFEDREMLLYYIAASESCIMSFNAIINDSPSRVYARTEKDSKVLLIPVEKVRELVRKHAGFSEMFYSLYDKRYEDLMDTIHQILLNKMDERLYTHLLKKSEMSGEDRFKLSHADIANELGTVREVISRVIKKLELEGKLSQDKGWIKIHH